MLETPPEPTAPQSLITISIHRHVRPGREAEYESGLASVLAQATTLAGTRGASVVSLGGTPAEYQILLHFESEEARSAWGRSPVRREWMARMAEFSDGDAAIEVLDAQQAWLIEPDVHPPTPPPRHKVALLTWVGIFPVITVLLGTLGPTIAPLPLAGRTFILTACAIPLMTWIVMPVVTRLSRGWLQPAARPSSEA